MEVVLADDILADAQAAVFSGHERRAVLALAMACAVAVRHAFSGAVSSTRSIARPQGNGGARFATYGPG